MESRGMDLVDGLEIMGGAPLHGEIGIQGSKNAVLPILAACLLGEGVCVIENCPQIKDVADTLEILRRLGCRISCEERTVSIDASGSNEFEISGDEAARIRSSILFLGALLGRRRKAVLPLPGGCAIGARPIDQHIAALRQLGARFYMEEKIAADAGELKGGPVRLALPSVGATENAILASVLADGETVIAGAAQEPEIDELCAFLLRRGADISRTEEGGIRIRGGRKLGAVRYRMKADRIVAGTYLLAAAATRGEIFLQDIPCRQLDALVAVLRGMGAVVSCENGGIRLTADRPLRAVSYLETAPYPGFPTDLQSPLMAALCRARGESRICETIFESRFRTVPELRKMGARIRTDGSCAVVKGIPGLAPAKLCAPDLRGGAALVIAALQANGRSVIRNTGYIARGYEDICRDLRGLGAEIRWLG